MPIDRAATLRNAEKLLRQGKLDQAIAEYLRVVEDQPRDWSTANVLGDLYIRAGRTDRAVEQFIRIADHLKSEGFVQKAAALFKKVLKLKPDHEHALLQAGEIASSLGLAADARAYFNTLADRRRARGDRKGIAEIVVRLGALDPDDYEARIAAARARVELADAPGAVSAFKAIAAELIDKGRPADALPALREAATLGPEDPEVRAQLTDAHVAAGDYAGARACASTAQELKTLAVALEQAGQADEALAALREAAVRDPGDAELKSRLAGAFAARGEMAAAAEFLTPETAGDDPRLVLAVADLQLRSGKFDEGLVLARRLVELDPARRQDVAALGWSVADRSPDAGYALVQIAADTAVAQSDYASAAAALQEFVTRVPGHIPALQRLVDVCVDGGLEATMYSAQAHLADAYIAAGSASEARFIAEDLVAREPWDRANIERFRRALVLLGESDPDGVIAERLSGQSPFMSTDLSLAASQELPPFDPVPAPAGDDQPDPAPVASPPPAQRGPSEGAIDLEEILVDMEASPTPPGRSESVEIDLSIVLDSLPPMEEEGPVVIEPAPADVEVVFARMRDESSRRAALDSAEEDYRRGLALVDAGRMDEAVTALEAAARAPRLRFVTASLLGRIYRKRGMTAQTIEWFERAAEAPPPSPDEGHSLMYELAEVLETAGEAARALAICMELHADAGEYRDVAARIDRLAKVQARG